MKPEKPLGQRTVSTLETDTSSESLATCFTAFADLQLQLADVHGRIFEAGESDIGHADATPISVVNSSGDVVRHNLPITAVRVAGLVGSTSAQDVANFLEGVQLPRGLDSITFSGDAAVGTRSAVVEVADETSYQIAVSKTNQLLGTSRLQIFGISPAEIAASSRASALSPEQHNSVSAQQQAGAAQLQQLSTRTQLAPPFSLRTDGSTLKLRGLPYTATVLDILDFFEGFQVRPEDVHLETRHDRQGKQTGTGLAYVQFSSPDYADEARHTKHKQMMGTRYVECMTFIAGRQQLQQAGTTSASGVASFPPLPLPGGQELLAAHSSAGAMPQFRARVLESAMGSPGWSRPFSPQPLYPAGPAREGQSPSAPFRHGPDQVAGSASTQPSPAPSTVSSTPRGPAGQLQGQVPFGLQQQQQQRQLMIQQQYALQQQQQQQMLMQQQAMQQWGGQQWQGSVGPLGLPQGWMRPFPMGLAPAGPLQIGPMPSRRPLQGGIGMADSMAYGYPAAPPGYTWAPMQPPNPSLMRGQGFAGGQQTPGGGPYAPRQDTLDSRMSYSPHGGRTPGRGHFRTPFSNTSQTRLSRTQSQSALPSQVAMTAESSADATSTAQIMSSLEALSLTDSLGAERLTPIMTLPALSPSDVILASTARSHAIESHQAPTAAAAAQMIQSQSHGEPPILQEVQVPASASLAITAPLGGPEIGNDAATVASTAGASSTAAQSD